MRTHRKPDLLFVLAVIASIGVAASSYIQYMRANANVVKENQLSTKQLAQQKPVPENSLVLVSTQPQQAARPESDPVNNSLPRP
jgi:hypothetical protein